MGKRNEILPVSKISQDDAVTTQNCESTGMKVESILDPRLAQEMT